MTRRFYFRDDAVRFLEKSGFRYCQTLGWLGWWNPEKRMRAIVDFSSQSRRTWTATYWTVPDNEMPPGGVEYRNRSCIT